MNKIWMCSGNTYSQINSNFRVNESLPVGIYNIVLTRDGFVLEQYAEKFTFEYKVYGLQNKFINHVIKTYDNTEGNLGIMFTGTKGTGKTVTAKELSNRLNLPVIIVKDMDSANQGMIEFLSSINCDCVLFMDEFEKNFDKNDSTVLQIMDGVYNSPYRRVFLLTTNELTVNENLLGRPSRIRYVKKFGNLDLSIVNEYLNDTLILPEARQSIIDFIDTLTISTIDILKAIVSEVNIHGVECISELKEFFNVVTEEYTYTCLRGYVKNQDAFTEDLKFNIAKFLEAAENYVRPKERPKAVNPRNPTEEERQAVMDYELWKSNLMCDVNYKYITSEKIDKLKKGDDFNYDEEIEYIDLSLNIIVTSRYGGEYYCFYLVKNPDARPSLYNSLVL